MHSLPIIHTGFIVYQMCAFVGIQFQVNMIAPTQDLFFNVFTVPNGTRNDSLVNVFPSRTMYETQVYYPNGTSMTKEIKCFQPASPDMQVVYLFQLYCLIVCLYIMILDFLLLALKIMLAGCFSTTKISKQTFGTYVLLYLIEKNVGSALNAEIHELHERSFKKYRSDGSLFDGKYSI